MMGTAHNADRWTVVFTDSEGTPVEPDGPVTWTIETMREQLEVVQQPGDAVAPGTYELVHTPERPVSYTVKASAVVLGIPQATAAMTREVQP